MSDTFDDIFWDDETSNLIEKYEKMLDENAEYFFDIFEFEDIIDHYIYVKQNEDALQVIDYADKLYPSEINFSIKKALVYIEHKAPNKALETLASIELLVNGDVDFYLIKGEALVGIGESQKASEIFYSLFEISNEDDYSSYAIDIFQIFDKYNEQLHAIEFLKLAFSFDPENISLLHFIAYCYEHIGQSKKSIACYKDFLNEYPFSDNAWFNLGIMYYNQENYEKSIDALEYAIAINPDSIIAYFHLANAYFANDMFKKAIIYYKEFLKYEEDDPIVEYYLGQCYNFLGNKDLALKHYERCIKEDKSYAYAYFEIAKNYEQNDENEKALKTISNAIELEPDNDEFYNVKGIIYFNTNEFNQAAELFEKALEINAYEKEYIINLSDTYLKLEEYNKVIELFEAKKEILNDSLIYFRLASCYLLINKKPLAISNFEKGLKLNYSNYTELLYLYPEALKIKEIKKLLEKYK